MQVTKLLCAALFALTMILAPTAGAQCGRAWTGSPNGVSLALGENLWDAVYAMAEWTPPGQGTPVLVVGGDFITAGDQVANNIAYWNGTQWHNIGLGLNAPVNALTVLNGVLYAGGDFTGSSGTTLHYLAYWTGSAWADVAGGTDGSVRALATNGSEIVLGGSFQHVGGTAFAANKAAHWSPATQWSVYGSQPMADVDQIVIYSGQPTILTEEAGESGYNQWNHAIYRWSGSQWLLVERIWNGGTMGVSGGNLFFSESVDPRDRPFDYACSGISEDCLMRFDGTTVQVDTPYRAISSFVNWNGQLYVFGQVHYVCGGDDTPPAGPWMASWNGSQWLDVSSLAPGNLYGLLGTANGVLYVGGNFDRVGSYVQATNIARLNGFQWQPLAVGLDGPATCSQPGTLNVGGTFTHEGASSVTYEASWNGQGWTSPTAFNGAVTCLGNYAANSLTQPSTVASGSFTSISGTAFNHIASHDPFATSWTALGTGIDAPALTTLAVVNGIHHNDLIVGGQFINAGGVTCNRIARWTGAAWAALGTGMNSDVRALAFFNSQIVAGGSFTTAGGVSAGYIAGWNGTAWAPIGGGMNGAVRSLLVYNGVLLAGGDFTSPAPHLAAWNGTAWSAFNGGADGTVNAMVVSGSDLMVGGSFAHLGTTAAANIGTWSTANSEWETYGDPDGPVLTLSISNGSLVAGGSFTHMGGQYSPYAAVAPSPGDPSIFQQPVDAAACRGQSAQFTVSVDRGGWFIGVNYNWYHGGNLMSDGVNASGSDYSGCHTQTITISNAASSDAGGYWCIATTDCGQTVTSNTVQLTVGGAGCCGSPDFNCDGAVGTDADIESFFACLSGNCPAAPCASTADFNADGAVGTDADIEAFFRVLSGGNC
jgi:hypothetical protein